MSFTKIVIIVLVLIGVLFAIFVVRGAFRNDPKPSKTDRETDAKNQSPPGWTETIEGIFSKLKPKNPIEPKTYTGPIELPVPGDEKQPFRTIKFHLQSGVVRIKYEDKTPIAPKDPLEDLKEQDFKLPGDFNAKNPKADLSRGSVVALKKGGKVTITCEGTGSSNSCSVDVE